MRKITITEALNELKLYDAKIMKAIAAADFVGTAKKSSEKIGYISKDTFITLAKSSYQSVTDLIRNRSLLKSAIVQSNANTEIEVAGKKMTVAEAIERKTSIEYDKLLLDKMKSQYVTAIDKHNKENKRVDSKVDELIMTLVGKDSDKKISKEDQEAIEKPYRDKNEFEMIDPLNINEKISALDNEIDEFMANIDTRLAISNSITTIELDF